MVPYIAWPVPAVGDRPGSQYCAPPKLKDIRLGVAPATDTSTDRLSSVCRLYSQDSGRLQFVSRLFHLSVVGIRTDEDSCPLVANAVPILDLARLDLRLKSFGLYASYKVGVLLGTQPCYF